MPRFPEYELRSQVSGPAQTRRATAEDFGAGIGYAVAEAGRGLQETGKAIERSQAHAELSDVHAKMAEAQGEYTTYLQESLRTADPADKTFADNFLQKYDDHVSKIGEGLSTAQGKNLFNQLKAQQRAHFLEASKHGQADLAGVKAKEDYLTSLNSASSSLLQDPSSFDMQREQQDLFLKSYVESGGNTEAALKLKAHSDTELAKSAISGWAATDPDYAKELLNKGRFDTYFDGDVKRQMYGHVDMAIRAKEVEAERRRREQERILAEQQMKTQNQFLKDMVDNKLDTNQILNSNLDAFGSGSKSAFLNMLETHNKAENKIKADSGVFIEQWDRIHLPDGDPRRLTNENELNGLFGRGLDLQSIKALREEMQNKRSPEGQIESQLKNSLLQTAKSRLTKSGFGVPDPDGDQNYHNFLTYFLNEYESQKKAGKTPNQLLDEASPDYLGRQLERFVKTPQQNIEAMARRLGNNNAAPVYGPQPPVTTLSPEQARRPGESISQWRTRLGR